MKCATCGCEAYLKVVHPSSDYRVERDYWCEGNHETRTEEVLIKRSHHKVADAEAAAVRRTDRWRRDQAILRDLATLTIKEIAAKWGISTASARHIRDTVTFVKDIA